MVQYVPESFALLDGAVSSYSKGDRHRRLSAWKGDSPLSIVIRSDPYEVTATNMA